MTPAMRSTVGWNSRSSAAEDRTARPTCPPRRWLKRRRPRAWRRLPSAAAPARRRSGAAASGARSSRVHPLLGLRLDAREAAFPEQGLGARAAEHADRAVLDFVEVRNVYALAADEDQLIGDDTGQPAVLILPLGRSRQRQEPMFDCVLAMPCACTPASGRNDVAATRNRIRVRTGFPSESTEHAVEDDHGHHRQQREATATMKMSKYDCLWFSPQMASSVITAPLCGSASRPPEASAAMRCRICGLRPAACSCARSSVRTPNRPSAFQRRHRAGRVGRT